MTVFERIEALRKERKISQGNLEKELGFSNGSISKWKKSTPTPDRLQKLATYFGVSIEYLMTGEKEEQKETELTKRDAKQIENILANTEQLLKQDGLMFDGNPASPEAVDSIISAMQVGMEMAKKRNKELYTPKKYKEDR
mgnify:CR=1 FL=1